MVNMTRHLSLADVIMTNYGRVAITSSAHEKRNNTISNANRVQQYYHPLPVEYCTKPNKMHMTKLTSGISVSSRRATAAACDLSTVPAASKIVKSKMEDYRQRSTSVARQV
jgi:hypothetical protein